MASSQVESISSTPADETSVGTQLQTEPRPIPGAEPTHGTIQPLEESNLHSNDTINVIKDQPQTEPIPPLTTDSTPEAQTSLDVNNLSLNNTTVQPSKDDNADIVGSTRVEDQPTPHSPFQTRKADFPTENPQPIKENNPIRTALDPSESEGMKALATKEKQIFDNLMSKSNHVLEKLVILASEIGKIESSADVLGGLAALQNDIQQVAEAFQDNFRAMGFIGLEDMSPEQPESMRESPKKPISDNLDALLSRASKVYNMVEALLKPRISRVPSRFEKSKEIVKLFRTWEDSKVIQNKPVKRYFNEISTVVAKEIEQIGRSSANYQLEIPRVVNSQTRDKEVITNVSTVSTIISAVTAAIIAESLKEENPTGLFKAVNAFWFFSLALSIAAVVNSMLDLFRRSYLSRRGFSNRIEIPYVIQSWIRISPRIFLAASVIAFQAALCLLVFASEQPTSTSLITVAITALSSLALIVTISWFAWHLIVRFGNKTEGDKAEDDEAGDDEAEYDKKEDGYESGNESHSQTHLTDQRDPESGGYDTKRQCSHRFLRFFHIYHQCSKATPIDKAEPTVQSCLHPSSNQSKSKGRTSVSESKLDLQQSDLNESNIPDSLKLDSIKRPPHLLTISPNALDPQYSLTYLKRAETIKADDPWDMEHRGLSFSPDGKSLLIMDRDGDYTYYTLELTKDAAKTEHQLQVIYRNFEFGPRDPSYTSFSWFPMSQYIAFELNDFYALVPKRSYQIYDAMTDKLNYCGKTDVFPLTEHVQFLHSRIGILVLTHKGFTLYYEAEQDNLSQHDNSDSDTWSTMSFRPKEISPQLLKCFCITYDDGYIVWGTARSQQPSTRTVTHVSVINLRSGDTIVEIPLSQDLRCIVASAHSDYLIFEYNNAPPELWKFNPNNQNSEDMSVLELHQVYQLPPPNSSSPKIQINHGHLYFAGGNDEMIVYSRSLENKTSSSGPYCIWDRESGQILTLPRRSIKDINYVVCSPSTSPSFFILFELKNGDIEVWFAPPKKAEKDADDRAAKKKKLGVPSEK